MTQNNTGASSSEDRALAEGEAADASSSLRDRDPSRGGWNDIEKLAREEYREGVSAGAAARQMCRCLDSAPTLKAILEDMLGEANRQAFDRSCILSRFAEAAPEEACAAHLESFARINRLPASAMAARSDETGTSSAPKGQQRGPEGETPTLEGIPVHRLCSENNGCILVEEKMEACCGSDACLLLNEARDATRAAYERAAKVLEAEAAKNDAEAQDAADDGDVMEAVSCAASGRSHRRLAALILALIDKEPT